MVDFSLSDTERCTLLQAVYRLRETTTALLMQAAAEAETAGTPAHLGQRHAADIQQQPG